MFNPISPEVINVIHQDKIRELERQIELIRIAKEQRGMEQTPSRINQAAAWMRERVLRRAAEPQLKLEEPCPTTPC